MRERRRATIGETTFGRNRANCVDYECGDSWEHTTPVGSFAADGFGLHDMHGNVWEWVEDCRNDSYAGTPSDGSVWESGNYIRRVLRGGSWDDVPRGLRAANRRRVRHRIPRQQPQFPCCPDARAVARAYPVDRNLLTFGVQRQSSWSIIKTQYLSFDFSDIVAFLGPVTLGLIGVFLNRLIYR